MGTPSPTQAVEGMSVGHASLELPEGKEASMPALGTSLVVKDVNNKNLFSKELWWWNPRPLTGNPLFTRVDVLGYSDLIAESPVFMMMTGIENHEKQTTCLA